MTARSRFVSILIGSIETTTTPDRCYLSQRQASVGLRMIPTVNVTCVSLWEETAQQQVLDEQQEKVRDQCPRRHS